MRSFRLWLPLASAVAAAACSDQQPALSTPSGPSFNSFYDCLVKEVQLSPSGSSILQGTNLGYHATAIGKQRGDNALCTIVGNVSFTWSATPSNLAQVGQTSTVFSTGYADIYGAAPGNIKVIVSATTSGITNPTTAVDTVTATVVARTATPTVGAITGPAAPSASGTYNYSVTASGGNGSYSYVWETRHGGGSWTVAHTASGGSPNTAPIPIVGGRVYSVRVRVTSGTSYEATSAEYTVDATGAAPPLAVTLDGNDNLRSRGEHGWEAMPTGGTGSYTYSWRMERAGGSDVTGYTDKTFSWWFDSCDEEPDGSYVEVTVTSGSETAVAFLSLNVETYLQSPCD